MNVLAVKNLTTLNLKGPTFTCSENSFTLVAGPNNSGKTTLIKALAGLLKTKEMVFYQEKAIETLSSSELMQAIGVLLDSEHFIFYHQTVEAELRFPLELSGQTPQEITKKVKEAASFFSLEKELRSSPQNLSTNSSLKLQLAKLYLLSPKVVLLDEPTRLLSKKEQEELISCLLQWQKKNTTIVMTTSSLDNALLLNDVQLYILDQGEFVLEGDPFFVFSNDGLLSRIGLNLPFMVDLSIKLHYYNVTDTIELEKERLVEQLWK